VVGTPEQIADRIEEYRAVGVTGINIMSILTPGTYVEFIEHVGPELQRRGIMQREYFPGTMREKMFSGGAATLPTTHPARRHRAPGAIGVA
jgi:long-chain alkane monooxygenase